MMTELNFEEMGIIEEVLTSLRQYAYGDIEKGYAGGSRMGVFILCSCLIDAMVGFSIGKKSNGPEYIKFINKYLDKYNGKNLWNDLRCKLVHSYSEGGSYNFIESKPDLHLKKYENKININLENFISEIDQVLRNFETKARNSENKELRQNIVKRFRTNGIIQTKMATVYNAQLASSTYTMTTAGYSASRVDAGPTIFKHPQ
jgi:hypothetical protein